MEGEAIVKILIKNYNVICLVIFSLRFLSNNMGILFIVRFRSIYVQIGISFGHVRFVDYVLVTVHKAMFSTYIRYYSPRCVSIMQWRSV